MTLPTMEHYNCPVKKALQFARYTHGQRALQCFTTGQGGRLSKVSNSEGDYELVTWLVVLDPDAAGSQ